MANVPYIALADDDADDQEMLAYHFHKSHPEIPFKFFKNGEEIIAFLHNCPTDQLPLLVILDYKMPIQTGAEVLKTLQAEGRYNAVRKVIWSTSGNNHFIAECLQYGAEKYFTKPNNIQEIMDIVTELFDILRSAQTADIP